VTCFSHSSSPVTLSNVTISEFHSFCTLLPLCQPVIPPCPRTGTMLGWTVDQAIAPIAICTSWELLSASSFCRVSRQISEESLLLDNSLEIRVDWARRALTY
jgi:hypothetical protein